VKQLRVERQERVDRVSREEVQVVDRVLLHEARGDRLVVAERVGGEHAVPQRGHG
jgi:hypothetical protein